MVTKSIGADPFVSKNGSAAYCGRPVLSQIDGGVHGVDIALVQLPAQELDGLAEAMEVDDLPLPQEFDHIVHIRVIGKPQDIVIGDPSLLLWHA